MLNVIKEALVELGVEEDKLEQAAEKLFEKIKHLVQGDAASLAHNIGDVADNTAADISDAAHNVSDVAQNAAADVKKEIAVNEPDAKA